MVDLKDSLQSLLAELKRRHVFRVALVYIVVSWVAMQVASVTFPALHLPSWTLTLVVVLLLAGLPVALLLAWAFEITPDGVRRTQGPAVVAWGGGRSGRFAGVAVLVGLAALTSFVLRPRQATDPDRVVVLPFENRTGDEVLDPVGQMTADGITQHLARTGLVDLAVAPEPAPHRSGYSAGSDPDGVGNGEGGDASAGIVVTGAYYMEDGRLLFQAQVTDAGAGRILSAIDPASSPVSGPREAIDLLGQRVAVVMAVLFDTRLDDGPRRPTFPSPRFGAYTEMRKGLDRLYASDFEGAIERFRKASAVDTAFLQPLLVRGAISVLLQRYAEADSIRETLLDMPDRLTPLELVQADALAGLMAGDWTGFGEAWAAGPDLAPSLNAFLRAWAALRADRPKDAVAILGPLHPDRGGLLAEFEPFWDVLTTALHAAGEHGRELREARRAVEHLPASPLVLFMEARALAGVDRPEEALARLSDPHDGASGRTPWRLVAPLPDIGAAMLAASLELRAHGHERPAVAALRLAEGWYGDRAGENDGARTSALSPARLAYAAGALEEASARAEAAAAADSADVKLLGLQGAIAAGLGDTATASRAMAALETAPQSDVMGRRAFARARIAYLFGKEEQALDLLRVAQGLGYDAVTAMHLEPELAGLAELARTRNAPAS